MPRFESANTNYCEGESVQKRRGFKEHRFEVSFKKTRKTVPNDSEVIEEFR